MGGGGEFKKKLNFMTCHVIQGGHTSLKVLERKRVLKVIEYQYFNIIVAKM